MFYTLKFNIRWSKLVMVAIPQDAEIRIRRDHIVAYWDAVEGGSYIMTSTGYMYPVRETAKEIDNMFEATHDQTQI